MRRTKALLLAIGLLPAGATAGEPCPVWRERQTMDCMRGYLRIEPAVVEVVGGRPGAGMGLSLGLFRKLDVFAAAFGGRAGVEAIDGGPAGYARTLHAGPELRLGGAGERTFGYFLIRGGYSRRLTAARSPFAVDRDLFAPGAGTFHYGVGAGLWGRLGRRFLLGAEAALDIVQWRDRGPVPTLALALSLGAWL